VAGQLVDAWRFSHPAPDGSISGGDAHFTAPLPLSFQLAVKLGRLRDFEGGEVDLAVGALLENGSCSQAALFGTHAGIADFRAETQNNVRMLIRTSIEAYMERLQFRKGDYGWSPTEFTEVYDDLRRAHPDWSVVRLANEARFRIARGFGENLCHMLQEAGFPLPRAPAGVIASTSDVLAAYLVGSSWPWAADNVFSQKVFDAACRGNIVPLRGRVPASTTRHFYGEREKEWDPARRLIHARLSLTNAQPVGIGYCSNVLVMPQPYRGYRRGNGCDPDPADSSASRGTHASIVVGRRWNPARRTCQLLVRNSWGKICKPEYTTRAPWGCSAADGEKAGQIWVDEEDLARNSFDVSYITP
jgi:hypothetical protein